MSIAPVKTLLNHSEMTSETLSSKSERPLPTPKTVAVESSPADLSNTETVVIGGNSFAARQSFLQQQSRTTQNQVEDINSRLDKLKIDLQEWESDKNTRLAKADFIDLINEDNRFKRAQHASDAINASMPENSFANTLHLCLGIFKPFIHLGDFCANEIRRRGYATSQNKLQHIECKYFVSLYSPEGRKYREEIAKLESQLCEDTKNLDNSFYLGAKVIASFTKLVFKELGKGLSKLIDLPKCFEKWKESRSNLATLDKWKQQVNGLPLDNKNNSLQLLLEKRRAISAEYLEKATSLVSITDFSTLDGFLKHNHLSFNDFANIPTTAEDWNALMNDPVKKLSICKHFANQFEMHDVMTEKALRASALQKIEQEHQLMSFNSFEHLMSIPLSVLQIALCIGMYKACLLGKISAYLFAELPGAPFANFFYPKLELSGITLSFSAISYLFAYSKGIRPNAFSLEWVKIKLMIDLTSLMLNVGHTLYSLKKIALIYYIQLIEKRILKQSASQKLEEDARYQEISKDMEAFAAHYDDALKNLFEKLGELNLKDAQALLNVKPAPIEEENPALMQARQDYAKKRQDVDHLSVLIESMGHIQKDCVSTRFLMFCKQSTGIDLFRSAQAPLDTQVETFFIQGGNKFVAAFQDLTHHEWAHLHKRGRVAPS